MSGAGSTRGGFYSYFESKSDLYAEVLGCFFTDRSGGTLGGVERELDVIYRAGACRWCALIHLASTSRTWRTGVRWWRCRRMSRAVARGP